MAYFNGKTLVVATEEQANNPLDLAHLIKQQNINMVSGTPSRWQTWLTSDDFCQAISKVRICRAGGEKFSDQLLAQMRSVTNARIFNCYGPTEITVASNNKELTHAEMVTVGRPQLNVCEFVVDSDGNELPVGVVGELYIGGRGVARGYNNLDEMTRERFIDYHGTRIYRSGDYARWLPDGDVVILGRTDHQIKLRGLRIELGEIENVMLKVKGIEKVVILIRKLGGKEHLCAYYTADHEIAPDALKAEISKSLTQYMVPTAYLQLSSMPMTPTARQMSRHFLNRSWLSHQLMRHLPMLQSVPSATFLLISCRWIRLGPQTTSLNWVELHLLSHASLLRPTRLICMWPMAMSLPILLRVPWLA